MTERRGSRRAVAYSRFSTDHQASSEDQQARNRAVAAGHGLTIVKCFDDPGQSRSRGDRPDLLRMRAFLVESEDVRCVVVNELSRLTGSMRQRIVFDDFAREHDISIFTEDGVVDPRDEDAVHGANRQALEAVEEVRKTRNRTKQTLKSKVQQGVQILRPPFGTRMSPVIGVDGQPLPPGTIQLDARGRKRSSGKLEEHPDELPWVVQIFQWVGEEELSIDEVARRLTSAGVLPKNFPTSGRRSWAASSVRGILDNPFYKGVQVWGATKTVWLEGKPQLVPREVGDPDRIEMTSPLGALVDPVLWQLAQDVRERRSSDHVHRNRQVNPARAFDHLVFCARCGYKMYGHTDGNRRKDGTRSEAWIYTCVSMRPGREPLPGYAQVCAKSHSMTEKRIISALLDVGAGRVDGLYTVTYAEPPDRQARRAHATGDLLRVEARWERTLEMCRDGLYSVAAVQAMRPGHEQELLDVRARLAAAEAAPTMGPVVLCLDTQQALRELDRLLTERQLPGPVLAEGLGAAGLVKVLADSPSVQFEWMPGR